MKVTGSLFTAIGVGFRKEPKPNTFEKGPFAVGIPLGLLIRFLWAHKENEYDYCSESLGFKCALQDNILSKHVTTDILNFLKRFGLC